MMIAVYDCVKWIKISGLVYIVNIHCWTYSLQELILLRVKTSVKGINLCVQNVECGQMLSPNVVSYSLERLKYLRILLLKLW